MHEALDWEWCCGVSFHCVAWYFYVLISFMQKALCWFFVMKTQVATYLYWNVCKAISTILFWKVSLRFFLWNIDVICSSRANWCSGYNSYTLSVTFWCIKQNVEKALNDTFHLFFETVDMLLKSSPPKGSLAYTTEH